MAVVVIGVPNSASAYCVGVEEAPTAVRAAGLIDALRTGAGGVGGEVVDLGDLTERRWSPDHAHPYAQNVEAETEAFAELVAAGSSVLADGDRLLVLGGSCLVAVGVCGAFARAGHSPRLVYIDRHLDLNTPHSTTEGSLSWMGMAHALALPGTDARLTAALGSEPLLDAGGLSYLGVDATQATEWERDQVAALGLSVVSQADLVADPRRAARRAVSALRSGPFAVHLDVDVLDFLDAPLAENVNGRNSGPTIEQVGLTLAELARHPDCLALSIGQLVPAHAASDPESLPRLVRIVADALAP
jgi:arginase